MGFFKLKASALKTMNSIRIYYTPWGMKISCFLVLIGLIDGGLGKGTFPSERLGDAPEEPFVSITMESYQYSPSEIILEVGRTVIIVLRNQSFLVPHNFLLDDPQGIRLLEADVSSGEEQRIQFRPAISGRYNFYCDKQLWFFPSHRTQGMEGRLLVR